MNKRAAWLRGVLLLSLGFVCLVVTGCSPDRVITTATSTKPPASSIPTVTGLQTFNGFVTSEDDFVDEQIGADPSKDTKGMILMNAMARSGLGIAVRDGEIWKFYYFSGDFASTIFPAFNGTGAQLDAWNIVLKTNKQDHISISVSGYLDGTAATNPSGDADGIYYPVIKVQSIAET